jgi:hypothetical protein
MCGCPRPQTSEDVPYYNFLLGNDYRANNHHSQYGESEMATLHEIWQVAARYEELNRCTTVVGMDAPEENLFGGLEGLLDESSFDEEEVSAGGTRGNGEWSRTKVVAGWNTLTGAHSVWSQAFSSPLTQREY